MGSDGGFDSLLLLPRAWQEICSTIQQNKLFREVFPGKPFKWAIAMDLQNAFYN